MREVSGLGTSVPVLGGHNMSRVGPPGRQTQSATLAGKNVVVERETPYQSFQRKRST